MRRAAATTALLGLALAWTAAWPQSLQLRVESRELYAELPFTLSVSAQDFEEEPAPAPPELEIDGCKVTYLGVNPNVFSQTVVINGRRSETRSVTFVYRWRVEAAAPGSYTVPPLTVTQGTRRASSPAATFSVRDIETTPDMIVRMNLPERPVWVGETFDVGIEWLLTRDVDDYEFVVPLFDLGQVRVESPATARDRTLSFPAGPAEVELPIRQDSVEEGGDRYTRFRFPARVTTLRPGTLELEPVKVAARLESGSYRDAFGFRRSRSQLYKAEGRPRRLVVRPLPQNGRPASFENAIGSAFSISVQASRTVVQVGDPIDLTVRVRGDGPLEGLSLPALNREGGLPPDLFSVLDTEVVGVIDAEENAKDFQVTVRVRSAEAREIPPIEFSYFDPGEGAYATARSQPIALSVAGSNLVGAADVTAAPSVSAASAAQNAGGGAAPASNPLASLVGADMSLSAADRTLRPVRKAGDVVPLVLLLYALPLVIVGGRIWQLRTSGQRDRDRRLREAARAVMDALAGAQPAREAAPRVVNAMRALARLTGREAELRGSVLEQLETGAFDPATAHHPVDRKLAKKVKALAAEWVREARGGAAAEAEL